MAKVTKQLPLCSSFSNIEKEDKDSQFTIAEMPKEVKVVKDVRKEKQSFDMFEDSPITKPIKKEVDTPSLAVTQGMDVEGMEEDCIKTEMYELKNESSEITTIKSEPGSLELCHLSPVTSLSSVTTPDSHQNAVSQSHPVLLASADQPNAAGLSIKEEVQQPSDPDEDFSVDVMLDNLDYVKSEHTEGSDSSVKQEKEVETGKNEGDQVSTTVGAKSKTQVKRVTWNIQEPEGPQPEKSASKLALYKLKLKQEGAHRPSTAQTSSKDVTGAVSDPSKKGAVGSLCTFSSVDGLLPEGLSATGQGEAEEGDLSRKDKYLKKLHMQERAIEEVKLAIKPFYQKRDINKDEYKEILRKAVQKVCHSKSGEINPVKVGNLVKAYVDKYKHARKHKKGEDLGELPEVQKTF